MVWGLGVWIGGMFILMLIFMVTKEGLARVIMALVTMDTGMLIMDTGDNGGSNEW